jgi:RNA polymerase sigma factor (sigma-70 family)
MSTAMIDDPSELSDLLRRAAVGEQEALRDLLSRHRDRLKRMVHLRLSRRLQGRVDDSDVLQEALNSMDPIDREVLALKHFEQLSTSEIAEVLGLSKAGAGSRYLRAIKRSREILSRIPGLEAF